MPKPSSLLLSIELSLVVVLCTALLLAVEDTSLIAPYRSQSGWKALLNGRDLNGWHSQAGWRGQADRLTEWFATAKVDWSLSSTPLALSARRTGGPIIVNGDSSHTSNLITNQKWGDVELYLEFMLAKSSNSGVYLQGLYEVQIFDSYAAKGTMTTADAGAIYEHWKEGRGFGGSAPLVNASRAPGVWQFYHIWFRAPRFNAHGQKTQNARFIRVVYNGTVVQDNVEVGGPTRSALEITEAGENPLMLQGDHGPVAFRNLYVKSLKF